MNTKISKQNKSNKRSTRVTARRRKAGISTVRQEPTVSVGYNTKNRAPRMKNRRGEIVVEHREWLATIPATSDFAGYNFTVNPGREDTFPWLSLVAQAYEKFDILDCALEYVPCSPTLLPGYFSGYVEYDVNDEPPSSNKEILNQYGAVNGPVWAKHVLRVDSKKFASNKSYFISNGYQSYTKGEALFNDPCRLSIAIEGAANEGTSGNIFVVYKIRLMVPTVDNKLSMDGGKITLTGFSVSNENEVYVPNFGTASEITYNYGNMPITIDYQLNGFKFTKDYTGVWGVLISIPNGFDAGRPPIFKNSTTLEEIVAEEYVVTDTYFSDNDVWCAYGKISIKAGSTMYLAASLTTGNESPNSTTRYELWLGAFPPRWYGTPDPSDMPPSSKLKLEPKFDPGNIRYALPQKPTKHAYFILEEEKQDEVRHLKKTTKK
jgi:hypothetical protein